MERGGLALDVAELLQELQALLVEGQGAGQVAAGDVDVGHLVGQAADQLLSVRLVPGQLAGLGQSVFQEGQSPAGLAVGV